MISEGRVSIRNSIATKLLRVVFSLYLVIAVSVTIGHMVIEYRYQKNSISHDLVNIQKSFENGLSVNMWQLDQEALESEIEGMLQISTIVGVKVRNENGKHIAVGGIISNNGITGNVRTHVNISGLSPEESAINEDNIYQYELFEHQFPISYIYEEEIKQLGTATIYSSSLVVYQRVKLGFLMLVVNAVLKTIALWLIFLWFSNILLRKPLAALTTATDRVSLENLGSFRVNIETSSGNELKLLEHSFNNMIENLNKSIIERNKAEKKIQSQQYYLEKAQEIGAIGTWELDIVKNILIWTDQNYRNFGIPIGTPLNYAIFMSCVHPDDREYVNTEWMAAIEGKPYDIEHRIIINGKTRWVREKADLTFDREGRAIDAIGFTQDITERKNIEEGKQKIHKIESIGILAGGIAHDFNNLLSAILNSVYLSKRYIDRESKGYKNLESAELAVNRATNLTQQLLTFSRGGAPVKKTVSIIEIIEESAEFALKGANVKCEYILAENIWPVEVDEGQIHQVIHNLILNADQAMPEGGIIHISTENIELGPDSGLPLPEGRYVKVAVKDHGTGISEEHLQKIFDPYFTTKEMGRGLGLSIIFSIINQHNGHISAESELGVGTTFTIYLPASEKQVEEKKASEAALIAGEGKVLLMDDEEIVRDSLGEYITMAGYEIDLAKDGDEAIELYKKAVKSSGPFSAVILDLTIRGGMGGKEVMKKLYEIDPGIKAIVSSGYSNDPVMANYKEYGFSGVFCKAFNSPDDLCRILNKVIKA